MKLEGLFLFIFSIFFLASCSDQYPGYSESENGTFFKLEKFGESRSQLDTSFFVNVRTCIRPYGQSYCDYQQEISYFVQEPPSWNVLSTYLSQITLGDSISIIAPFKDLKETVLNEYQLDGYEVSDTAIFQIGIELDDAFGEMDYYLSDYYRDHKNEEREREILQSYVEGRDSLSWMKLGDMYMAAHLKSKERFRGGDEIALQLNGFFLNDSTFHFTANKEEFLYFTYGNSDQVIRGLELALSQLYYGDSVTVVIPSYMAFGKKGSGLNIVPGNTPVGYDFKVLDPDSIPEK